MTFSKKRIGTLLDSLLLPYPPSSILPSPPPLLPSRKPDGGPNSEDDRVNHGAHCVGGHQHAGRLGHWHVSGSGCHINLLKMMSLHTPVDKHETVLFCHQ